MAYYFNRQKLRNAPIIIILKSFAEGVVCYGLILLFFLYGFYPSPLYVFVSIFTVLFAAYFVLFNDREYGNDFDVQMETSKNTIVLFTSTVLLLFVLLTIFRYMHPLFQFSLAVGITVILNVILYFMKDRLVLFYDNFSVRNLRTVSFIAVKIFFILVFVLFCVLFFNFPRAQVNNALNLEHHSDFFAFFEAPVTVTNRYDSELLFKIDKEINNRHLQADITVTDTYIFIYYDSSVVIVDKESSTVLYDGKIEDNDTAILVPDSSVEDNETEIVSTCGANEICEVEQIVYDYKDVSYEHYIKLTRFDNLAYDYSETAIFDEENILLFNEEQADSLFKPNLIEPFWDYEMFDGKITDVDNGEGKLVYIVTTSRRNQNTFEVYEIVEKEIGLPLPFYTYFHFGSLIVVLLFALIPITNYEAYTKEISFDTRVFGKQNTNK